MEHRREVLLSTFVSDSRQLVAVRRDQTTPTIAASSLQPGMKSVPPHAEDRARLML